MSTTVETRRLGWLYQYLISPATKPNEASVAAKARSRSLKRPIVTSIAGLTTARPYPPFEGFSRLFDRFLRASTSLEPIQWFAVALVGALAALVGGLLWSGAGVEASPWLLGVLAVTAFVAERQSIQVTAHAQASISGLPVVFAAVVCGPLEAIVVGACALLGDFGRPHTRWTIWTASRSIAGGLAGLAALAASADPSSLTSVCVAVAVAVCVDAVVDGSLAVVTAIFRRNSPVADVIKTISRMLAATLPFQTIFVTILAYTYLGHSPWASLLFLLPAIGCQRLLVLYREQRRLADDLREANVQLERANLSFASGLVAALDARDRYTAGHSAAVAIYARDIAAELGLPPDGQQTAHLCGLLHDIGKVGVAPAVLEKAGPLTATERNQMEEHSVIGARILANVEGYSEIAHAVRHHHERWDGKGYPDGLYGEEIPLISRIISVADAYSAMTSARPYRQALSTANARSNLQAASGSQFDPIVVEAFDRVLCSASDFYIRGARSDFAVEAQKHWTDAALSLAPAG
jgi:putative nucleotidyltransferase with HDIG domain